MSFTFEKLEVYKKSLEWVQESDLLLKELRGKVSASLSDQLSRAALSISQNIAEGAGRWHKAEKRQFYWIARGSAYECIPILQVLCNQHMLDEVRYRGYYKLLEEIGKMLSGLILSTDKLKSSKS